MAEVIIDAHEKKLLELFDARSDGYSVRKLPLGDVQVEYLNGTHGWLAERKTVRDLYTSLLDGRWAEQRSRLLESGWRIVYIIEGDFDGHDIRLDMINKLKSAVINAELRRDAYIFRTLHVEETFDLLCMLIHKLECFSGRSYQSIPSGIKPPKLTSKTARETTPMIVLSRMLRCIPGISERAADKLASEFRSVSSLQRALSSSEPFPRLQLDSSGRCLGKRRLTSLRNHLLGDPPKSDNESNKKTASITINVLGIFLDMLLYIHLFYMFTCGLKAHVLLPLSNIANNRKVIQQWRIVC